MWRSSIPQYDDYISVLAFGSRVQAAVEAAEAFAQQHDVAVRVVNMRFVKPLDEKLLAEICRQYCIYSLLLKNMRLWVVQAVP